MLQTGAFDQKKSRAWSLDLFMHYNEKRSIFIDLVSPSLFCPKSSVNPLDFLNKILASGSQKTNNHSIVGLSVWRSKLALNWSI